MGVIIAGLSPEAIARSEAVRRAADAREFAEAHRALRADPSIQFDMQGVKPPDPPPAWLKALGEWLADLFRPVGRFLRWIGSLMPDAPYARILLWTVIALAAFGLCWMIYERVRGGVWRMPVWRRARTAEADEAAAWMPDAAPARAWLKEADALAGEGRFAEAVHHLLIRSVEDIGRKRPNLVRPALTARDIAGNASIPSGPRTLFADIAAVVERSLFGGRPVDAGDWGRCRQAYQDFAQTRVWVAPR
jgi:hypothetical protein